MMKRVFWLLALMAALAAACSPQTATSPSPAPAGPLETQPAPAATTGAADPCPAPDEAADPADSAIYGHTTYVTFTEDGRTFNSEAELAVAHASVPDLTIGPDGQLWMYYVNGIPGQHGIFVSRRTETGAWETVGCVTLDGAFNGNAVDPNVTRLPDGRYRLVYFEGNFVSQTLAPGDPNPIYSAISEDGLHFTVEGRIFSYEGATDPSLVQLPDGSWRLAVKAGGRTVVAASPDGQNFEPISEVQWNGIPELYVFPDGSLGLYLARFFLSSDGGQTWQPREDIVAPGNGNDPSLVALPQGGYAFAFKKVEMEAAPGGGQPSGGQPPGGPPGNPFASLTLEQEACLKDAWGEEIFVAITGLERPPEPDEIATMEACGLQPPGMGGNGQAPGGQPPGGQPPGGQPPGGGFGLASGNPQDVTLNLDIREPYLLAFHACNMAEYACDTPADHQVYLAQSADGRNWSLISGWQPYNGSVPDLIRRGETLYIFSPGTVTRYHLDSGLLEATTRVTIEGLTDGFVDPSLLLDDDGNLVLFFVYGRIGGDPGGCQEGETSCTVSVGVAREVPGSDGTRFTLLDHNAVDVEINANTDLKSVSDPDVFYDGERYVLYVSHGLSVSVWTADDWQQPFSRWEALPQGLLSYGAGGVPSGYFDPKSGQYWTYVHYASGPDIPTEIRLAQHPTLDVRLQRSAFTTVLSGASIGLGADYLVASPSILYDAP